MARVTVEDCLENVKNRFELVMLASKRARQLMRGSSEPKVAWENDKATVVALREIAMGYTDFSDAHHADHAHRPATAETQMHDDHEEDHDDLDAAETPQTETDAATDHTDADTDESSTHETSESGHSPESE